MATGKEKAEAIRHAIDTKLTHDVMKGTGALTILCAMMDADTFDVLDFEDKEFIREWDSNMSTKSIGNSSKERQAIRFMFADFVAYMLEDEDDEQTS